jgi:hypothetical protein
VRTTTQLWRKRTVDVTFGVWNLTGRLLEQAGRRAAKGVDRKKRAPPAKSEACPIRMILLHEFSV